MKKLIVMMAAAVCAIALQAASVNWSATPTSTTLSNGNVAAGVKAYIFEGLLTPEILSTIADGTWTASGYLADANAAANGAVMKTGVGDYANETVSFSMILLNAADYASATEYKYGEVKDVVFVTAAKPVAFANSLSAATWQSIGSSVPEPTSALMLLVGLAGLALRRKQA